MIQFCNFIPSNYDRNPFFAILLNIHLHSLDILFLFRVGLVESRSTNKFNKTRAVIIGGPIRTKNTKASTANGSVLDVNNGNNKGGANDNWTADEDMVQIDEKINKNDLFDATIFSNDSTNI